MAFKLSVVASDATVALVSSPATTNEGTSVTITLTSTGVQNGQVVPYVISGTNITSSDISGAALTGNFIVQNGNATLVLNIANDFLTEGFETLIVTTTLRTGLTASTTVGINDTSLSPSGAPLVTYPSGTLANDPYTTVSNVLGSGFTMVTSDSGSLVTDPYTNLSNVLGIGIQMISYA
jgi:hypothetical protein